MFIKCFEKLYAVSSRKLYIFQNISSNKRCVCTLNKQNLIDNKTIRNEYQETDIPTRLLKAVIIGQPNAGKSTLINNIMDRKVCPVSNKVHTTRKASHAIINENYTQIVFLDTPGIVSNKEFNRYNLEKSFTKDCHKSLHEADIIGVMHDVSNQWTRDRLDVKLIKILEDYNKKPSFLILNKIDTLKSKRKLLDLTRKLTENKNNLIQYDFSDTDYNTKCWPHFSNIFMVSALTGDGVIDIKKYLISQAKPSKWLYPEKQWTNESIDDIIVRTVQATLLDFLPQEIPYKLKTVMELFEISETGKINAVVLVTCPIERIRKLVVGVGDGKLRQITEKAQNDLLNTFDEYVKLQIVVVTKK